MKRIMKIAFALAAIMLTTSANTKAQEKKEQQQIKIIVADKDGKEVVIDTTFSSGDNVESIKLKDGKIVYITRDDDSSESISADGEKEKIIVVKNISHPEGESGGEVMVWTADESDTKVHKVIYINKCEPSIKEGEVKYNIEVTTDESGKKIEKTSYVIARDGMVVTIEGGNEEKVRELAGIIESSMGVKKDGKTDKEVVKEETKKTVRK